MVKTINKKFCANSENCIHEVIGKNDLCEECLNWLNSPISDPDYIRSD